MLNLFCRFMIKRTIIFHSRLTKITLKSNLVSSLTFPIIFLQVIYYQNIYNLQTHLKKNLVSRGVKCSLYQTIILYFSNGNSYKAWTFAIENFHF